MTPRQDGRETRSQEPSSAAQNAPWGAVGGGEGQRGRGPS